MAVSNLPRPPSCALYQSNFLHLCQLQGSLEILIFIGNLHRPMIIYQMANAPSHIWLHVSLFMHNSQDYLTSG